MMKIKTIEKHELFLFSNRESERQLMINMFENVDVNLENVNSQLSFLIGKREPERPLVTNVSENLKTEFLNNSY